MKFIFTGDGFCFNFRYGLIAMLSCLLSGFICHATPLQASDMWMPTEQKLVATPLSLSQTHETLSESTIERLPKIEPLSLEALTNDQIAQLLVSQPGEPPEKIGFKRDIDGLDSADAVITRFDWRQIPDGETVGLLKIRSPGAKAIRLGIRIYKIPDTVDFRFLSENRQQIRHISGAFINSVVSKNLKANDTSQEVAQTYWTPTIEGESTAIELRLPRGVIPSEINISIDSLSHIAIDNDLKSDQNMFIFKGKTNQLQPSYIGAASKCTVDVACTGHEAWRKTAEATARMTFTQGGQSSNCSGTLLNSSGDISIPYFLSAWHCIPNQAAASTLETDWFFEANSCNSSVPGKSWFTAAGEVGGAELLFSSSQTDVSFMKLNRTPNNPYTPVTYLTYSGWTTAQIPSNRRVTSISHPRADLKKVAKGQTFVGTKFCKPKIRTDGTMFFSCEAAYNYAIGIPLEGGDYKEVGFDTGDVFTGSSGSGLFLDDAQLLAGTQSHLSKDTNTCGIATAGYGAFNVSYAIGNLGKWLNPDPSTFAPKNLKMSFGGTDEIDRHAYIISEPPGFTCDAESGTGCSASFPHGTQVKLTVYPKMGYEFYNWPNWICIEGSNKTSCTVSMIGDQVIVPPWIKIMKLPVSLGEAVDNTSLTWSTSQTTPGSHKVLSATRVSIQHVVDLFMRLVQIA